MAVSPKVAWAEYLLLLRAARVFIEVCGRHDVPVVPVKGIIAAHTLYDEPAKRALHDVDMRIRPQDYERLRRVAREHRWHIRETKRAYLNIVIDFDGVDVDVECHVGPPHMCSLTVEDLLRRSSQSRILGFEARIPDFTDHVVIQLVNLFKDKIVRARSAALQDLSFIAQHREFDAGYVAQRMRESSAATIGWVVSDYAARQLGICLWGEVRDALGATRPTYIRALQYARRRPEGTAAILLTRLGSDDLFERLRAVTTLARWAVERSANGAH